MKIAFCLSSRLTNSGSAPTAIIQELRFVAHLLDDVVRGITLGPCNSQIETISAVMPEIMHRAVEPGPMLLLLGRELQFGLDPIDIRVAVGDDLFSTQLRFTLLGEHRLLLGVLSALGCLGGFR